MVRSVAGLAVKSRILAHVADGTIAARVEEIQPLPDRASAK